MPTSSVKQKCTAFAIPVCFVKIAVITLVLLFFAWITTPKARLSKEDVTVKNLKIDSASTSPSFSMELGVEIKIKNRNFGRYEISNGTATVAYSGMPVGMVSMGKDKVKAMSSKKIKVAIPVNYKGGSNSQLNHELGKGVILLSFHAKFKGRVRSFLMFIKEGKTAELKCTMMIDGGTKGLGHMNCHVRQISFFG